MPRDIPVHATPVWTVLAPIAPAYAGDPRLALPPAPALPGWPVGLERRLIASRLPRLAPGRIALRHPAAAGFRFADRADNAHLLARPPSELAAWRLWRPLAAGPLDAAALPDLARLLGGDAGPVGVKGMATDRAASGHRFLFAPRAEVPGRLARLLAQVDAPAPALPLLLHAAGIYLETLLVHPWRDGNGRLARLLFQASLRRTTGLAAPLYPLGPAKALHREHHLRALLAWELDRDPRPLLDFLLDAVVATRAAVDKLL
jgi:hypothetical protein